MKNENKTLGQKRIGNFNPESESIVDVIKTKAAELIDYNNDNVGNSGYTNGDDATEILQAIGRLKSLAYTDIETATMWAVKAHMHYR